MALEAATLIHQLDRSNPVGSVDKVSKVDDHIRMIKAALQNTVPNVLGVVIATHTELNFLSGVSSPVVQANQKNVPNGVAGLDSAGQILAAQMPNDPTFVTARLTSTILADLLSGGQALQIGASTAANLAVSAQIMQARVNGAPGPLYINPYGGQIEIGVNLGNTANYLRGQYTSISGGSAEPFKIANTADANPPLASPQNVGMGMYTSVGQRVAFIGYPASLHFRVRSESRGGQIQLEATTVGGALQSVLVGIPGSFTYLYQNGAAVMKLSSIGAALLAAAPMFEAYNIAGNVRLGFLTFNQPYSQWSSEVNSAIMYVTGRNVGGILAHQIICNPDAGVSVTYQGNTRFDTTAAGGTLTGAWNIAAGGSLSVGGVAASLAGHTHDTSALVSGILPIARGGTGTNNNTGTGVLVLHQSATMVDATLNGTTNIAAANVAGSAVTTLASFPSSLAASGYQRLPSGFMIQWGTSGSIASGGSATVTFPVPFATLFSVTISAVTGTFNSGGSCGQISGQTTTGFGINNGIASAESFNWMALGIT